MKLFILDRNTNKKVYLTHLAPTRSELANLIGSPSFTVNGETYHVNNVVAESNVDPTVGGSLVGAAIGSVIFLGVGTLAGGFLGGLLGNENRKSELNKVNYFNHSKYLSNTKYPNNNKV